MKNKVDLLPELRAHIARKYKSQARAAAAWGLSSSYVCMVLKGMKNPTAVMLDDAGIEAVHSPVVYVRKSAASTHKTEKEKAE